MNKGMKIALIVGAVLIASLIIIPLTFGLSPGWENCEYGIKEYGMMGPWMMTGLGGWPLMGIIWLVVIGLIVWLVVYLARSSGTTTNSSAGGEEKVLEILKTRYARGEIDKSEYQEKLKDLK